MLSFNSTFKWQTFVSHHGHGVAELDFERIEAVTSVVQTPAVIPPHRLRSRIEASPPFNSVTLPSRRHYFPSATHCRHSSRSHCAHLAHPHLELRLRTLKMLVAFEIRCLHGHLQIRNSVESCIIPSTAEETVNRMAWMSCSANA